MLVIVDGTTFEACGSLQKFCSKWHILHYFLSTMKQSVVIASFANTGLTKALIFGNRVPCTSWLPEFLDRKAYGSLVF
jgi:hypothetical protein